MTIQQLAFQRGEETLTECVVVAISNRSHGWSHIRFPASFSEGKRSVLAALIGVVNNALGTPLLNGHLQGIHHQFCPQVIRHRPAHDPSAKGVHIVPILAQPPPGTGTRSMYEYM